MAGTTQYNVGIHISAVNNVTPVLNQIANQLRGLQNHTVNLTGKFHGLRSAIQAAGAATTAWAGLHAIEKTLDKAKELSHEMVQIKKLGLNDGQYNQVVSESRRVAGAVPGVTETDAAKAYGSTYSMFGHDAALGMMEEISKFAVVLGNTTHDYKGAADKVYEMIRAGDLMGKFVDEVTHKVDVGKLKNFLDLGARITLATHGKVDPKTWLGLAQQGGPALGGMTDDGLMTMGIVAQAMGGQRGGTAVSSLYSQFIGGITTQRVAAEMKKVGMISDYQVQKGGHVQINDDQKNAEFKELMKRDLVGFTRKLMETWKSQGKNMDQMVESLYTLFGRQTTQRLVHDLLRNLPQIEGERDRAKQAMGVTPAAALANKEDLSQVMFNMSQAWDRLLSAIGNSKAAIDIMAGITDAFNKMTDWVNKNPNGVENFSKAVAGAVAAMTVLAAVEFAVFLAGGPVSLGIKAIALLIGILAGLNWDAVAKGFQTVLDAIRNFAAGIGVAAAAAAKGLSDAWKNGPSGAAPNPNGSNGGSFNGAPELPLITKPHAMNYAPPARNQMAAITVHTSHVVDGQVQARSVSHHIASLFEHPTTAAYADSNAYFPRPDGQMVTV